MVQMTTPLAEVDLDGEKKSDNSIRFFLDFPNSILSGLVLDWRSLTARNVSDKPELIHVSKKRDGVLNVVHEEDYDIEHLSYEAKPGKVCPSPASKGDPKVRCRAAKSSIKVSPLLLGSLLIGLVWFQPAFGQVQKASAGDQKTTNHSNQVFPHACLRYIRNYDCPFREHIDSIPQSTWDRLNKECCSQYPGTALHCQEGCSQYDVPEAGGLCGTPVCLPDVVVPPGQTGMIDNTTGTPMFLKRRCGSNWFEDRERNSSSVAHPYCTKQHSRCNGDNQERLCNGGSARDNLCICTDGFKPNSDACLAGFGDDDINCACKVIKCPPGQRAVRVRKLTQQDLCADVMEDVQLSCIDSPTTPTVESADSDGTGTGAKGTKHTVFTPAPKTDNAGDNLLIALPLVAFFVLVAGVIGYVIRCACCKTKERRPTTTAAEADSDGPSSAPLVMV